MAKKNDDITNILAELQEDILRITDFEIDNKVRDAYQEEVEWMYAEYTPKSYERRYEDKGFIDETNWDTEVNINKRGNISYSFINETETANNSPYRLDQIIETGKGYNWNTIVPARPVYERTMDKLEKEQIIEETLEKALKKKGW